MQKGLDTLPHSLGQLNGRAFGAILEHNQKLFTTPADDDIARANRMRNDGCGFLQNAITTRMAETIVDFLEVIDVTNNQRKRFALSA